VEDLKQAREIGARAVVEEPDCVRAHSVYGLTMLRFRYWDTAAAELQTAMRLAPDDTEIGQVLVDVYIQQAAYDKAIALGEALLPKTAKPARLHYKLGWAYGRRPQHGDTATRAIAHLKAANAAAPDWFEPYAELGRAYLSQGDRAEAQAAFEHSWRLNPTVPGVAYNLAALYQGHDDRRRVAMEKRFHELLRVKERFTALRRDYNSGADNVQNTLALASTEGSAEMYGAALYRLRKVLVADPSNIAALRLYVSLDQRARAGYPDYLAPGPGVGPAAAAVAIR
jgi:tetratricopeptide (TPR) repeat protein